MSRKTESERKGERAKGGRGRMRAERDGERGQSHNYCEGCSAVPILNHRVEACTQTDTNTLFVSLIAPKLQN